MIDAATIARMPAQGITLLEMALGLMIIAVLSVGVSSLVKTGVESQMAERMNQQMQIISNMIVDDLRMDFRQADNVTVNGNTLKLEAPSGEVTYRLANGRFSRTVGASQKVYNDSKAYPMLAVKCMNTSNQSINCFTKSSGGRQIELKNLTVEQTVAGNSVIDTFGKPSYKVHNIAFDVATQQQFQ